MSVQSEMDRIKSNIQNTYSVLSDLGADVPSGANSDNLRETAGSISAVLFKSQSLTDEQKQQARTNIGAPSQAAVDNLSKEIDDLKENGLGATEEQIQQIETNKNDIADLKISKVDEADLEIEVADQLDGAKADIVANIISQLGGLPVFGTVDGNNKITVTSTLSNGEYVLMYENTDGSLTQIGTMTITGGGVTIINLFDKTAEGFGNNTRLSSSNGAMKAEGDVQGGIVTNYICFPDGASGADKIYFKGIRFDITMSNGSTPAAWRHSSKSEATNNGCIYMNALFSQNPDKISYNSETGVTTYIPTVTIAEGEYIRFNGVLADGYTVDDIVITFNQEIV